MESPRENLTQWDHSGFYIPRLANNHDDKFLSKYNPQFFNSFTFKHSLKEFDQNNPSKKELCFLNTIIFLSDNTQYFFVIMTRQSNGMHFSYNQAFLIL